LIILVILGEEYRDYEAPCVAASPYYDDELTNEMKCWIFDRDNDYRSKLN
jgi:hypothetical protein